MNFKTPMVRPSYLLPIIDEKKLYFPVNKIICIGRNYADHAREMGHDPGRETPFFFFKPQSALAQNGSDFICPVYSQQVDYEIELVVALGKSGYQIPIERADDHVFGFALGLDMTCRDIQKQAKELGRPWELAKGFDGSAPCTAIKYAKLAELNYYGDLVLTLNEKEVQRGNWRNMIWSVPELIVEVSRYIKLEIGDLIFTGTPAGVGPVRSGDQLRAELNGFPSQLNVNIK